MISSRLLLPVFKTRITHARETSSSFSGVEACNKPVSISLLLSCARAEFVETRGVYVRAEGIGVQAGVFLPVITSG